MDKDMTTAAMHYGSLIEFRRDFSPEKARRLMASVAERLTPWHMRDVDRLYSQANVFKNTFDAAVTAVTKNPVMHAAGGVYKTLEKVGAEQPITLREFMTPIMLGKAPLPTSLVEAMTRAVDNPSLRAALVEIWVALDNWEKGLIRALDRESAYAAEAGLRRSMERRRMLSIAIISVISHYAKYLVGFPPVVPDGKLALNGNMVTTSPVVGLGNMLTRLDSHPCMTIIPMLNQVRTLSDISRDYDAALT